MLEQIKNKKGAMSLEYLAALIIVLVVVALIIWRVSTTTGKSGCTIDNFIDDDGDEDRDGIKNIYDATPCGDQPCPEKKDCG